MKKIFKTITTCLVMVLVSLLTINTVSAETVPNKITVKRAEVLSDLVTNNEYGFTIFTTSDGKYIYCMDVDKKALTSGQTATLNGDGDAGLLYILQNGYPNKGDYMSGNAEVDKYVTQAAVWWYTNESKVSSAFKNATKETDTLELVKNKIKPMVEKARSYKDSQTTPSMKVTKSNKVSLTSDKNYYETGNMSAALVGPKTYTVKVTGGTNGTVVVDENGNVKNTFNSSEVFKVRIPASELKANVNLTITISASGSIKKAKIYKPANTSYQRVAGLYEEEVPLSETVKLTASPSAKTCQQDGDKYYGVNGKEVDKKTYEQECSNLSCQYTDDTYYGKDGNIVDEATFNSECGQEVTVPNTSANIIFLGVAIGVLAIIIGTTILYKRASKKA